MVHFLQSFACKRVQPVPVLDYKSDSIFRYDIMADGIDMLLASFCRPGMMAENPNQKFRLNLETKFRFMYKGLLFLLCLYSSNSFAQTVGLFYNLPGAESGYVLFAPGQSDTTYLIDKCGKRVHQWAGTDQPGLAVYLLEDGTLLRCNKTGNNQFNAGGQGGLLELLDWNSNVIWSYEISDGNECQHHDAIRLPNGNILAIVWESHTKLDAMANGRVSLGSEMWSEKLVEIQPVGSDSGIIVWQWRAWDHLVQDADSTKPNFGIIKDHPELLDINLGELNSTTEDWLHFNSLDYNEELDQIMVSSHELSEVYIIDHSTTTAEAATHNGGNSGKGGDLLYRWGNPQNYGRGTEADRKFFEQHHLQWISDNGRVLLFNNGVGRPGNDYSTVETFMIPAMTGNSYPIDPDSAFEPKAQDWIYTADPPSSLFSLVQGGAQRLPGGNILYCNGTSGEFVEIDSLGNKLWKYISPVDKNQILEQGDPTFLNDCFRATYLPSYYAGFAGKTLIPGAPIELNPDVYDCENFPTGISGHESMPGESVIYPNPFTQIFSIYFPVRLYDATVQIHDAAGKLLYQERGISAIPGSRHEFEPGVNPGIIIITVKDALAEYSFRGMAVAR